MNEKKNPMYDRIKKKIGPMPTTELRLTAQLAEEELRMRRDRWVNEMYERFFNKETVGMAEAIRVYKPNDSYVVDRIIVNCFMDKSRSKVATGLSRVSPDDTSNFDYYIGVAIAFARAMGEPVPDLF
jgi:hypothetical protein